MLRLSAAYGRLLTALAVVAGALLFGMMLLICADVLLRNVPVPPAWRGIAWSNDLTEFTLYLLTLLSAPWLLRKGQHIRVDIVLRGLPARVAWTVEWLVDVCMLASCSVICAYGVAALFESIRAGSMVIKAMVFPEWWTLAPMPVTFLLLGIEVLFRMERLARSERGPRTDAVSAS